jgi:hypothetical protein
VALATAPRPSAALRGSVVPFRARKADRRSEADELRLEVIAAGQEMKAMATRITSALVADDLHSAHHFASRLWTLGHSYTNPEPEGGTAA